MISPFVDGLSGKVYRPIDLRTKLFTNEVSLEGVSKPGLHIIVRSRGGS